MFGAIFGELAVVRRRRAAARSRCWLLCDSGRLASWAVRGRLGGLAVRGFLDLRAERHGRHLEWRQLDLGRRFGLADFGLADLGLADLGLAGLGLADLRLATGCDLAARLISGSLTSGEMTTTSRGSAASTATGSAISALRASGAARAGSGRSRGSVTDARRDFTVCGISRSSASTRPATPSSTSSAAATPRSGFEPPCGNGRLGAVDLLDEHAVGGLDLRVGLALLEPLLERERGRVRDVERVLWRVGGAGDLDVRQRARAEAAGAREGVRVDRGDGSLDAAEQAVAQLDHGIARDARRQVVRDLHQALQVAVGAAAGVVGLRRVRCPSSRRAVLVAFVSLVCRLMILALTFVAER